MSAYDVQRGLPADSFGGGPEYAIGAVAVILVLAALT